ncbi:hypothetical protein QF032_007911 [Streptomyces achromogenes]|uniref:Uncharacterized protein n=1 Tax=Streptomyces achromogenes TaxID=67255 RepID=A0ABU0QE09_STRAH|nr:hypothetical protein [Streptomyces achromogenes]MDQ0688898.1 hypothetical protein [Streptomyces achromogenes]MDQ0836067.1 hypothetical protein [Streptomyces achromogenes]
MRLKALRDTRLHLSDPASVGAFAERLIERSTESDKLFRTSIENDFHKMRDLASTRRLEVITPETGQFRRSSLLYPCGDVRERVGRRIRADRLIQVQVLNLNS